MCSVALRCLSVVLPALLASTSALAASTARESLGEATAAAQKWQGDAVLTHVSTLVGRGDGTSCVLLNGRDGAFIRRNDTKFK